MKTKRLFLVFLSALLVVTMSLFAFACKKDLEPTFLRIDSAAECTIVVGEEYTLMYSTQGEVTVTASGGNYNAETKKFTADAEGEYTLTVKAVEEGKAETSKQVKITVSKGSDKTVLKTAIEKTNGLIQSDYTLATWTALTQAKAAATKLLTELKPEQSVVNETAKTLEDKIAALVPAEIAKASEEDGNLKNGTTVYFAEDYENMAAILEKVEELNADTTIKLNSVYASRLKAIIDTLVAKPALTVKGAPNGMMLVSKLVPFEITAETEEGAKLEWKLNGAAVTTGLSEDGKKFTYTPAAFGEAYKIEVTATVGEGESAKTRTYTYEGSIVKATYATGLEGVTVENNVISTEKVGWGDAKGRKAYISDLAFSGDVTVYFDLMFEEIGSPAVMGIFFLNASGQDINNWAVVSAADGFIEVATEDDGAKKVRVNAPTTELNKTYHFMAKRTVKEGKGYLSMYMLDDRGNIIAENTGNNIAKDYAGVVMLGIQTENAKGKIFNIAVENGTEFIDKTAITTAIEECKAAEFPESDYTAASYLTYSRALSTANSVLAVATTKEQIDAAAANLRTAFAGLVLKDIVPVEVEDGQFEFGGKTYISAAFKNFDAVVAEIEALTDDEDIKAISQYEAAVSEILKKLVEKVTLSVSSSVANGQYLVEELPDNVTFTATVEEGTTVTWKLNGTTVTEGVSNDGKTLTLEPEFKSYEVEVIASKDGDNSLPVTFNFGFAEVEYKSNHNSVTATDNVINVEKAGWGDEMGRKLVLEGAAFAGDVTVYFDMKFEDVNGDNSVLGIFFLNGKGEQIANWAVINFGQKVFEVATADDGAKKVRITMEPKLNTTYHIKAMRYVKEGKGYLSMWLLDDDGNVVAENLGNNIAKDYAGAVMIGIQSENAKGTLSNFRISNDTAIVDFSEIAKAKEAVKGEYKVIDYTEESLKAFNEALEAANAAYTNSAITSQEDVHELAEALKAACTALVKKTITKAETTENSFEYNGVSYENADYKNITEIIAKVDALNANVEITLVSEYDAAIKAIIAELKLRIYINVSGAPEGNLIVDELITYTLVATTEDADVTWTVNGQKVTEGVSDDGLTFNFTPAKSGEKYTIVASADREEANEHASKTFECSFIVVDYNVNSKFTEGITVEKNDITVNDTSIAWDNEKGKKVLLNGISLNGEFVVTMDVKVDTTTGDQRLAGLFLFGDGAGDSSYIIVNHKDPFLGINFNGKGEDRYGAGNIPGLTSEYRLRVSRLVIDGQWRIKGEILNLNNEVLIESVYTKDVCTENNLTLGIQVEHVKCTISNIQLVKGAIVTDADKKAISDAKDECLRIDEEEIDPKRIDVNFEGEDVIEAYKEARQEVFDAFYTPSSSAERIHNAIENFKTAYAALKETKIDVSTVLAETDAEAGTITYADATYTSIDYTNIPALIEKIDTLNDTVTEAMFVYDYDVAVKAILAELKRALEVELTAAGLTNNTVVIYPASTYMFKANTSIEDPEADLTFVWTVDGKEVENETDELVLNTENGKHVVSVTVTHVDEEQVSRTVTEEITFTFEKANVHTQKDFIDNRGATLDETDGTFKIGTGAPWGNWEGRKLIFDELVFNGSFSVQMDVQFDERVGTTDANVLTIHLLNADTITRTSQADNATVGYGCICLHENPVRLETGGAINKKQSNAAGYEEVATAMGAAGSQFEQSKKFTVKLNVYRSSNTNGSLSYDFSVWDSENEKWITFSRENDWGGDFSGGFLVGINIENAGVTLSNYKFELLEAGERGDRNYVAGSVKSKAELYNVLAEFSKDFTSTKYENGAIAMKAAKAAYAVYMDNSVDADYDAATAALVEAIEALVERTIGVTVEGLDADYEIYRGIDKFTAVFEEGVEATAVKWTYDFLAADAEEDTEPTAKEVEGAALNLDAGTYTNVKLIFTANGTEHTYIYKDFKVEALALKSNTDKVVLSQDGKTATVTDGAGWGPKDQLVVEGVKAQEFEMTFNAKYTEHNGDFRVMCINLWGTDYRAVFGWRRNEGDNRDATYWVGFDNDGVWNNVTLADSSDDYWYIHDNGTLLEDETRSGVKFGIKQYSDDDGRTYHIVFTVYGADGTPIRSVEHKKTTVRGQSSKTELRFTFENVNLELNNFNVMYN